MKKHYTGVGSRETPLESQHILTALAQKLAERGWILRTGCAKGADYAFELGWWDGCMSNMSVGDNPGALAEIYIPWNGFEEHTTTSHDGACKLLEDDLEAEAFARAIHPAWDAVRADGTPVVSQGAKRLHTRNIYQVLGEDLNTPSKFLVCWAKTDKHGVPKGGTRTTWLLAREYDIPCFNIAREEDLKRILNYI